MVGEVCWWVDWLMFHGDSYQIEHHLFPALSFTQLARASTVVKRTVERWKCNGSGDGPRDIPYYQFSYWEGYRNIFRQLRRHAHPTLSPAKKIN